MQLIENLKWRYSTKKFSDKKISGELIDQIIEATRLSASSAGLQPFRLIAIENEELKKQLGEGSFNSQIAESSHLLVFAAFDGITLNHIEEYIEQIAHVRGIKTENLSEFKVALVNNILQRERHENFVWASRQAYIALGTALIAAAELKIDATPMEGFDGEKFDTLLNLKERGLKTVVILALGYRDTEKDVFAGFTKVRLDKQKFVTCIE
ncbi:NAD(P)H-dependent oxidoreductase [Paenimyroides baculatum]|uniref:NAD(P)H-dependent oxidoreductase n=1 Tax=Paenimyroides baculatum TaxID=2608000 RepID=A0A5M6CRJ0_9FLAO|nr:NAD(P)H-dependent oxidoreductase [Paenimyroides baculatum]KAA5535725.1 NAD(P)H-dependent oxidoreductase [Paenimyroides baculatum]